MCIYIYVCIHIYIYTYIYILKKGPVNIVDLTIEHGGSFYGYVKITKGYMEGISCANVTSMMTIVSSNINQHEPSFKIE